MFNLNNLGTLNTDHVVIETDGADKILLVMIHEYLEWYREFPDCVNSAGSVCRFIFYIQVVIVLIQVYNCDIRHHSIVYRCGLAAI